MTTDPSTLDYAFPEGMHPALKGLAWLIGHWEGFGQTQWHDQPDQPVLQQIDFSHNGEPYLHYLLQAYADADGQPGAPVFMETGFWIPGEKNEVKVVLTNPAGVAQTWYGSITGLQSPAGGELATKVELTTDAAITDGTHTAGHRLYGYVQGKLMYAYDRADQGIDLQPYLTGELTRR